MIERMRSYIHDFVHAARTLVRARAFTAVCVTSLGLGMGVVIAILLLTRMLTGTPPGVDDDGLVEPVIRPSGQLLAQAGTGIIDSWSYPDYLDVRDAASGMVMTSEPLARQLFPTGDPLGQRVVFALAGNERQTYTVVGVTADLVSTQMGNPRPQLFISLAQHPASTILAIARGAASDPSVRRAFEPVSSRSSTRSPPRPRLPLRRSRAFPRRAALRGCSQSSQ